MLEAYGIIERAYIYVKAIIPRMLVNLAFSQPHARMPPRTVFEIARGPSDSKSISLFV